MSRAPQSAVLGDWVEDPDRACLDHDTDLFFPSSGEGYSASTLEALSLCRRCPVRRECGDYAVGVPSERGIWGGMTEGQRERRRRGGGRNG